MEVKPQNLDDLVEICKCKLKAILDNHAPMKERSITIRHTVPWFATEIMAQNEQLEEGRNSGLIMVKITNGKL